MRAKSSANSPASQVRAEQRRAFLTAGLAAGTLATIGGFGATRARAQAVAPSQADELIRDWPGTAQKAAKAMIEKYGAPDEATKSLLIWYKNGPWVRTTVAREEIDHNFPMPHKDVLEQFVNYKVPPDKFDELAKFDGSVIVERTKGEMSARCDKEAANILALNLAHQIVQGEKGVEEARKDYAAAIKDMQAGKPPEIMQKLQFRPAPQTAGDPDQALIKKEG